ncbi:hypothetical protein GGQ98_001471 [Sphingosinicella soli]|uniref:Uncharacterized protein n=1 Tax=Sphingosinicella soli TaxID=333708 RepID=A0A7W7B0M2_9SPHN|nr:hypothetical protein [Sphingosinicella soli]
MQTAPSAPETSDWNFSYDLTLSYRLQTTC